MVDFTGTRPRGKTWGAHISKKGRQISLGNWPSEKEAALAYDCAALYLRGDGHARNFPNEATPKSPHQLKREAAHARNEARGADSKYIGVISLKRNGATVWKAQAKISDSQTSLGEYAYEKDAARAYDAAVRHYFDEPVTNFDGDEALPLEEIRRRCKALKHERGWPGLKRHTSRYRGVYLEGESSLWYAQITAEKQHVYLGRYRREADAARAYDAAALAHFGDDAWTNIPQGHAFSNLQRHEGKREEGYGWSVYWQRYKTRQRIFFADSQFGGRWQALRIALKYRDTFVQPGKQPGKTSTNITTRVQEGHGYLRAIAYTGEYDSVTFSLQKMSLEEAVRRAAAWRYEKLEGYYKEHNPYNSAEELYEEALARVQD